MFDQPSTDYIGSRSTRSFTEIILKTIAISTTTTIAAGHLNSLRCISRKDRAEAVASVVFFLIAPTLPLATLIYNIYHAFRSSDGGDLSFNLGIILGMRATPISSEEGEVSVPLYKLRFRDVQRVSKEYDLEWAGRMFVLLLFEVQAAATFVLFVRRCIHKDQQTQESATAAWDICDGVLALGGAITGLISIGILLLNHKWESFQTNFHGRAVRVQEHVSERLLILPESMLSQMILAISICSLSWSNKVASGMKVFIRAMDGFGGLRWFILIIDISFFLSVLYPFPLSRNYFRRTLKYLPIPLRDIEYMDKVRVGAGSCGLILCLTLLTISDAMDMKASKAEGWWLETMWVDPLSEKLYVF